MNRNRRGPDVPIRVDELLQPSAPEMDLNQLVEPAPAPLNIDPVRSTTDPLQINFASVDIGARLHNTRTGPGIKSFALVFIGGPTIIAGLAFIFAAWTDPRADALHVLFKTLLGVAVAGFWPYIIFANGRRKSRNR